MPSSFHDPTIELAVELQRRSKAKYDSAPDDIVRGALFVLSHDAVRVHRAVGVLANAGWASPGSALLRTLVDISISAIAIVNSASPPMAAFRYFYGGFRRHARDQRFSRETRAHMFEQIRARLKTLPEALRAAAVGVVKEKDRGYWFGEEFAGPSVVLERFSTAEIAWIYSQLSSAAHGSFFGLRLFRESPDAISVNPEPIGRRAVALDLTSCRLLAEVLDIRNIWEQLDLTREISTLRRDLARAATGLS